MCIHTRIHIYIYIYIYICIDVYTFHPPGCGTQVRGANPMAPATARRPCRAGVTPNLPMLRSSPLRLLDSKLPGNSLRAWEFHPLKLRFCLSQTL